MRPRLRPYCTLDYLSGDANPCAKMPISTFLYTLKPRPKRGPGCSPAGPVGNTAAMTRGVVAAGHPLTAEAGASALRAGGNAVDAALAAMCASFVCEPLLTGLGAGGYLLVGPPDGDDVLLDFSVEAPGRDGNWPHPAELVPASVVFC